MARATPSWLITDFYVDTDLGVIATGKEGEVGLVERTANDGIRSHLLARKRYRPRTVTKKGELQALGFERAPTFRNDIVYRDGRNYGRRSRDRRAVESMTKYGKELVKERWLGHEYDVMSAAWEAGASVPYPTGYDDDGGLLLEYVGDRTRAAPRLAQARLDARALRDAWSQLQENLRLVVESGWVHADLSAYNALWWDERLWLIDFPQAVDLVQSPHGFDLLHRDVTNISTWFTKRGVDTDAEAFFAELVSAAFSGGRSVGPAL
ncbi:MAG TPA: RIO1 family regulatory kinase/ATPase [Acidimicrobiales bacterium]